MPVIKMISPHKQEDFMEHCYYEQVQVKNGICFIPETFYQNKTVETLQKRGYMVYEEPKPSPIEIIKHNLELMDLEAKPTAEAMKQSPSVLPIPLVIAPEDVKVQEIDEEDKVMIDRKAEDSEWYKQNELKKIQMEKDAQELLKQEPIEEPHKDVEIEEVIGIMNKPKKEYPITEYDPQERFKKPVKRRRRRTKKEMQDDEKRILKNKKCRAAGCKKWANSNSEFCYKHSQEVVTDKKVMNYPNLSPDTEL